MVLVITLNFMSQIIKNVIYFKYLNFINASISIENQRLIINYNLIITFDIFLQSCLYMIILE